MGGMAKPHRPRKRTYLLGRLLEGHLHAQPYGSLIQAVPSGIRNLRRYVHEQTIVDVIVTGGAGLYGVAGSGAMHFVPNVKHFH